MTSTATAHRSDLSSALKALPIKLTAKHVALEKEGDWHHDKWSITLEFEGRIMTTSYSTGIGHRVATPGTEKIWNGYSTPEGNMSAEKAALRGFSKPGKVDLADVVSSLILDSSALDDSFEDWASNLGYDADSRKALATYLACQKHGAAARRLLGEHFEELSTLEH